MPSWELALPNVVQEDNYDCGPAAAFSVIRYLNVAMPDDSIRSLASRMGCTRGRGTTQDDMQRVLADYWNNVDLVTDWTYDGLREAVGRGDVCILDIQAWGYGEPPIPYGRRQSDGHWVAVSAVGSRFMLAMDPAIRVRGRLTRAELELRWHEPIPVLTAPGSPAAIEDTPGIAIVLSKCPVKRRRVGRWVAIG